MAQPRKPLDRQTNAEAETADGRSAHRDECQVLGRLIRVFARGVTRAGSLNPKRKAKCGRVACIWKVGLWGRARAVVPSSLRESGDYRSRHGHWLGFGCANMGGTSMGATNTGSPSLLLPLFVRRRIPSHNSQSWSGLKAPFPRAV